MKVFDVLYAPNVDPMELTHMPVIQLGDDNHLRITTPDAEGSIYLDDVWIVREVLQLDTHPITILATDMQVFIIRTADLPIERQKLIELMAFVTAGVKAHGLKEPEQDQ